MPPPPVTQSTASPPVILLTGFGPFPSVDHNATQVLVPALAQLARARHPGIAFIETILPTEWEIAPRIVADLIAQYDPTAALHFGVARGAEGFRIEIQAANTCRPMPDAEGRLPVLDRHSADGPDVRTATLPHDVILKRLACHGLPAALSDDAGGFLCNAVLYHSLAAARATQRPMLSGFVHIPADFTASGLSFDDALRGSAIIIEALVEGLAVAP